MRARAAGSVATIRDILPYDQQGAVMEQNPDEVVDPEAEPAEVADPDPEATPSEPEPEAVVESGDSRSDEVIGAVVNGPDDASPTGSPDDGVAANEGKVVGGGLPTV